MTTAFRRNECDHIMGMMSVTWNSAARRQAKRLRCEGGWFVSCRVLPSTQDVQDRDQPGGRLQEAATPHHREAQWQSKGIVIIDRGSAVRPKFGTCDPSMSQIRPFSGR